MGEQAAATITTVKTAIENALTSVQGDMLDVIAVVVPLGLTVYAAVWLVRNGKRVFNISTK